MADVFALTAFFWYARRGTLGISDAVYTQSRDNTRDCFTGLARTPL